MYAQLLALTAVAGWLAWRILRRGSSFVRVGAFATAATALIYTHYFAMLFIATLGVVVLVTAARSLALRSRALAVVAGLAIAIGFFAPWIVYVVAHRQPNGAGPEYADPDLFSVFVAALEMVLGFHSTTSVGILAAGWPALCLLAFVLLPKMRQVPWRIGGLLALVALPPALLVLVSAVGRNVFDPRYLTVAVAPLYLLLGALWGGIPAGRAKLAGSVALVGLAVAGSVIQVRDPSNPKLFELREALRGAAAATDPGDVLVLVPDFQRRPVMHYYEPSSGVRVVAATRAAETWRDAVSDDPRRVVLISTFEHEALGERDRGPAEYRRYFAARGELVSKQPYINATVRVYRPYGTTG
jgi:hypothetical protein